MSDELSAAIAVTNAITDGLQSQLTAARTRIEKLEAALREYAKQDQWQCSAHNKINCIARHCPKEVFRASGFDGYDIAQTALREEAE